MSNRTKNIIYSILLVSSVFIVMKCREGKRQQALRIEGATMGTTYHVTYFDKHERNFKISVDSILILVNKSINTYDSTSDISRFNKSVSGIRFSLPFFLRPLKTALDVYQGSSGAYDPTVMPLVNAWGFGPKKITIPDTAYIESVRAFIGFNKIQFSSDSVTKPDQRIQLDFGGIGQGYGADIITDFLKSKGVENMLVELGGEGMAIGINLESGKPWELGLVDPTAPEKFIGYISLSGKSFSTSGNYFNYREVNGIRYSHTIDPASGYPVQRALLSATVFAADCTTADAWATAFMSMGHEKAIEILSSRKDIDACLIWSVPGGTEKHITPGIAGSITMN